MSLSVMTKILATIRGSSFGWEAPWERSITVADEAATATEFKVADGADHLPMIFVGVTTLTTMWLYSDSDMAVTIGDPALNESHAVKAGSLAGFTNGELAAATALSVTFQPGDASIATVVVLWAGH